MITLKHREFLLKKILEERGNKCQNCSVEGDLNIHFIDGNDKNFKRNNLLLLCDFCIESKKDMADEVEIEEEKVVKGFISIKKSEKDWPKIREENGIEYINVEDLKQVFKRY